MAGDANSTDAIWQGPTPLVVLVRPQMGENIGAAARAMWNFGLDRMRIVDPRDGWPNERARALASGAGRVLDQARVVQDVAAAIGDCHHCYATTARLRDVDKPVLTPEQAMTDARRRMASGQTVAVLFGPERSGLENDDLETAGSLISVPVNPAFGSLNLAQCVLLLAYEWRRHATPAPAEPEYEPARIESVTRMVSILEDQLASRRFFFPEDKEASMRLNLRTMFSRMPLTETDVRVFHGLIKTLTKSP